MQSSIAAFIGLSEHLFERSEFVFAPMKARSAGQSRSDQVVGCRFFWLLFFGQAKKSDSQPFSKNKENIHTQKAENPYACLPLWFASPNPNGLITLDVINAGR
jgi:hypothetical protein